MKKGDLILISFPFTDLTGSKTRPALVLVERELDITVAFISTQLKWQEETDVIIEPSKTNGLKKESLIRLSKIGTIDKDLALGILGKANKEIMVIVNRNLKTIFQLVD